MPCTMFSSAMTSLHCSVEHRRNIHVHLQSPGRTESIVSSWRSEHPVTIEAVTLRRHDGDTLSSKTSESNTASETSAHAFTPQSKLTNPASLPSRLRQWDPTGQVAPARASPPLLPFRPTRRTQLALATGSFLCFFFFFFLKKTSSSSDFCLSPSIAMARSMFSTTKGDRREDATRETR